MKNFDNSLRLYNKTKLRKTRMHVFTKKLVDNMMTQAMYTESKVNLLYLTKDDIAVYKKDFSEDKFDEYTARTYNYEPSIKRIKFNEEILRKTQEAEKEKEKQIQKELEKQKQKELDKQKEKEKQKQKELDKLKEKEKQKQKELDRLKEKEKQKQKELDRLKEKEKQKEKEKEKEREKEKEKEERKKEILKLVLSRKGESDTFKSQFKTILVNEKDNSIVNDTNEQQQSLSPTSKNVSGTIGKLKVKNMRDLFSNDPSFMSFKTLFLDPKPLKQTICLEKKVPFSPSTNTINVTYIRGIIKLEDIETLYNRYFDKSVQDTIVIIANILNMISMSNKHHKARMDESFKKRTEAEKLKERCDANRTHLRHKKVLEAKLKANFVEVISSIDEAEFEPAFQMFFLSILTVLRVLDQPKFKKGSIFKNLVLLLWNSLKNSEFDHPKIFGLFRSKSFRPDCIELISLIEDSREKDPGVTDRMALFFVVSVNSREHFQPVIDAITGDSNEELGLLIDNASFQCRVHSQFRDLYPSTTQISCINQTTQPAPAPAQIPVGTDSTIQWVLADQSGIYKQVRVADGRAQNSATTPHSSSESSQHMSSFYETFSNSVRGPAVTVVPNTLATQVNGTLSTVPGSSNSTSKIVIRPSLQNLRTLTTATTTPTTTPEYSTIFVGNKQYQLIRGPSGQMKAIPAPAPNITISPTLPSPRPPIVNIAVKCFAKDCRSIATIMCSTCTIVKYCSHTCQRVDWYDSHIHTCSQLKKANKKL